MSNIAYEKDGFQFAFCMHHNQIFYLVSIL